MNELFNALLDISKLDAGALNASLSDFPVSNILKLIEATFAAAAREKGLVLRVVPSSAWIRSDAILLERVLLNLVSNAIRYTPKGGIVLGCRRVGDRLRIDVCDSGVGIPEDQQRNIFGEFYQIAAPDQGQRDGLGLGLAIVERLCALLKHPIGVDSTPGQGSRFHVTVPMVAKRPGLEPPAAVGRNGRPVARQADRRGRRRRPGAGGNRRSAQELGLPGCHRGVRSRGADKTRRQQAGPDHLRLSLAGRTDRHRGDRGAARHIAGADRGLPDQWRHPAGPAPRSADEGASPAAQADRADDLAHDDVPAC